MSDALVDSARLASRKTSIDPPGDGGEDFGRTLVLEPAHPANVGGLELLRHLLQHRAPIDPAFSHATRGGGGRWSSRTANKVLSRASSSLRRLSSFSLLRISP